MNIVLEGRDSVFLQSTAYRERINSSKFGVPLLYAPTGCAGIAWTFLHGQENGGLGYQGKDIDTLATAMVVSDKLSFAFDPEISCLLTAFMKQAS